LRVLYVLLLVRSVFSEEKKLSIAAKFKIVVLQSLHNLSDEQTEYLIRDRLSFMRFLDLDLEDPVPDAT
jgi:Transposase domain (DUF772)